MMAMESRPIRRISCRRRRANSSRPITLGLSGGALGGMSREWARDLAGEFDVWRNMSVQ
jgi:hypothetical protein